MKFILLKHLYIFFYTKCNYAELKRELRKAGCYPVDNSKHQHWYSPITKTTFQISHHDQEEVAPGTEHFIRKQSGVQKKH